MYRLTLSAAALRWGLHFGMVVLASDREVGVHGAAEIADGALRRLAASGVSVLSSSAVLGLDIWDTYYCRRTPLVVV